MIYVIIGLMFLLTVGVIVAGVVMNFLLAIVAFAIVYSFSGIPRETRDVKIVDVKTNSPAQTAGIVVGDIVRKVGTNSVSSVRDFVNKVEDAKGKRLTLTIERRVAGELTEVTIVVSPRENPPEGEGPLGVVITTSEIYYPPVPLRPFYGIYYGFRDAFFWAGTVVSGFIKIFSDLAGRQIPQDIAGPVGIFAVTSEAAQIGILPLINFIGILSVNLAILNIVPFPALDGGRLLFIGIEAALGRKVLPRVESTIHTIGMLILLILILAITAHDIQRLVAAGSISGFLNNVLK